ncbi:MAG: tetratricopeptide repeat protein [Aridibacter sp.]
MAKEEDTKIAKEKYKTATYFNLGLAHKGLNDYKSAADAFQKAVELDENDTDAHYELGFAFYKLNKKEEFNNQYAELLDLDEAKAEQLLENTYKLVPKEASIMTGPTVVDDSLPYESNRR